jgi:hypothetical protein
MGANDAAEMLEEAKAEVIRLEQFIAELTRERPLAEADLRMGQLRTVTGIVYMASILNGREGDEEALLENGEYLVGLHVTPSALAEAKESH